MYSWLCKKVLYKENCSSTVAQVGQAVERVIKHNEECQKFSSIYGYSPYRLESLCKLIICKMLKAFRQVIMFLCPNEKNALFFFFCLYIYWENRCSVLLRISEVLNLGRLEVNVKHLGVSLVLVIVLWASWAK